MVKIIKETLTPWVDKKGNLHCQREIITEPYIIEFEVNKVKCPKCKRNITTMKNLRKPRKYTWTCKCGENVTMLKLEQLSTLIQKELTTTKFKR